VGTHSGTRGVLPTPLPTVPPRPEQPKPPSGTQLWSRSAMTETPRIGGSDSRRTGPSLPNPLILTSKLITKSDEGCIEAIHSH
jgi:hypothetical protein